MTAKKNKKKKWKKVLIIILIVIACLAAAGYYLRGSRTVQNTSAGDMETAQVTRGSIDVVTEGDGTVEASDKTLYTADYALKVTKVEAGNGDVVSAGDRIALLDSDSIDDQISAVKSQVDEINANIAQMSDDGSQELTAPVTGRVKRIYVRSGDLLSDATEKYGGVMEISADGRLKVEFTSDEDLEAGKSVTVSFLSYEEDGYIASEENGVYTAVIDDAYEYSVDTEAEVRDENDKLLGTGKLESNHPYLVYAFYGRVDELQVAVNDHVDAGQTLLTRTDYSYNQEYLDILDQRQELTEDLEELCRLKDQPEITAEGDGILTDLTLTEGGVLTEGQGMYSLISTDEFSLKAEIDELDIAGVEAGQKASIVFDALEDEEFEGTVEKVSSIGNNVNGVTAYTVTITMPGSDEIKTNMSATVSIVTDSADDALLVPVDAVRTDGERRYVTVLSEDNTTTDVDVTLGLVNNTTAQITDGDVAEGDTVIISDGSTGNTFIDMMNSRAESGYGSDSDDSGNSAGSSGSSSSGSTSGSSTSGSSSSGSTSGNGGSGE